MSVRFSKGAGTARARGVAATAAAVALTAAGLVMAAAPPSSASSAFTLFDNTSYRNANLVADDGATRAGVVYDLWNVTCANTSAYNCTLPTKSQFQALVKFAVSGLPATAPITLDFEGIDALSSTPANQAANEFQAWQTLISWTRQVIPASQPLGVYSYDYSLNASEINQLAVLHQNNGLTFFAPSLYNRWATASAWTGNLDAAVANDHQINAGQPIYPYMWPQNEAVAGNPYLSAATWSSELNQLKAATQGAIIWSGTAELGTSSCGWLSATTTFATALSGGGGTGTLAVAAQLPGTCLLTRGQSVSIPVTVTNNGTTTSAATTLGLTAPTGISGILVTTTVPALVPGGTWSTTATLTAETSATLGDAHLSYRIGADTQTQDVIVQDPDLALGKTATQSSTQGSATADLAVDGVTDPAATDSTIAQTQSQANPWWQVDLGASQPIGAVYATGDNAVPQASYYLIVSDSASATIPASPIAPNQWVQTQPGTWVINVFTGNFRATTQYPDYLTDTNPRSLGVVPAPAGLTGRYVRVQLGGTGQLTLAEVQVRPGAPDGPFITDSQRVINGGFETGTLSSWSCYGGTAATVTTPANSGGYALQSTPSTTATGECEQTVSVTPNTTYTLSGFVDPNGANAYLGVTGTGTTDSWTQTSPTTPGYQQLSTTFTTGPSTSSVTLYVHGSKAGPAYHADDFTVTR
ncbi:hypothetical protein ABIA32_004356 [Streptacidiphilus sp. MAP12-20]|uniref:carbohydrate binding domain-containing protein n=1 Tax=Streptacidiphilus sp. MAP12-20 TaxID=3156299 RepID=UPI003515C19A